MRKLCIYEPVLQALSFIILLLPWNLHTLFCSILLLQQMVGDCSPVPKAAAEESDVLLKKKSKNQTKDNIKIFFLSIRPTLHVTLKNLPFVLKIMLPL